jgi:hypothetical protein
MKNIKLLFALAICLFVSDVMSQTFAPLYGTRLELKNGTNKTTLYPPSSGGETYLYLPTDAPSSGDVLTWNSGGYLSWNAVSGGSGATIQFARKTSNESYASTADASDTTMQDDDQLYLTFGAGEIWEIDGVILDTTIGTGCDQNFTFSGPSGTTVLLHYNTFYHSAAGSYALNGQGTGMLQYLGHYGKADLPQDRAHTMYIKGLVFMGGTGGDVKFRWAFRGNPAAGKTMVVRAGSYFKATKVQ